MSKEITEVDKEIKKVIKKNKRELETALIKPIHPNHQFSSNGLYLMIGKPGSGKTYYILKHILLSERLFDKPYYNLIVFCYLFTHLFKNKYITKQLFILD